jgi:enoyl-CoA hydratase/carnithine racemase
MSRTLDVRHTSPHVAEVWLNRPEVRNAFNDGVVAELTQTFELAAQDGLRAIVLAGHGKAFCAGADLSWMRSMSDYTWAQNHADASAWRRCCGRCGLARCPWLAASRATATLGAWAWPRCAMWWWPPRACTSA